MKRMSKREVAERIKRKFTKRSIKKGDKVKVLSGKDRGSMGRVLQINTTRGTALVEKINLVKRHQRPTQQMQKGGIIEKEGPVRLENLQLVCNKCNKATRIRREKLAEGYSVRVCIKCKEMIDKV